MAKVAHIIQNLMKNGLCNSLLSVGIARIRGPREQRSEYMIRTIASKVGLYQSSILLFTLTLLFPSTRRTLQGTQLVLLNAHQALPISNIG